MDTKFWHQRWKENKIAFHESRPNSLFAAHFKKLGLVKGDCIFLPLCGKTLDIAWLLTRGYRVAGVELSQLAIEQLFTNLGIQPKITESGNISQYSANNIDIFHGDFFHLCSDLLGRIDAIYDRAALVALPEKMRHEYVMHLLAITGAVKQLLITFEYDQSQMEGPPFSLDCNEIYRHYQEAYRLELLESISVPGGLKGICAATEIIWLLNANKN